MQQKRWRQFQRAILFCGMLCGFWSCSGPSNTEPPKPLTRPEGCHPFAAKAWGKSGCMLPYPSSYYLVKNDKSPTGYQVAIPEGVLPAGKTEDKELVYPPAQLNTFSGFSPATPIIALFDEKLDAKSLIPSTEIARSLKPNSPVQLIEFGTRRRIPLFAELDMHAQEPNAETGKPQAQVLLIRPMVRLEPNKRYAVVLLKGIKTTKGQAPQAPEAYRRLIATNAVPKTSAEATILPSVKETQAEIKAAGIAADQVVFAWDFRTASDKPILTRMVKMRDQILEKVGADGPTYRIEENFRFKPKDKKSFVQIVRGWMKIPTFLASDEPGAKIVLDDKGQPKLNGTGEFRFQVNIPECARKATKPLPIMMFGHGLFGTARGEMESGYHRSLMNRLCMVQVGADWIGLSSQDTGPVAVNLVQDFSLIHYVTDRIQQAHLNHIAFTRMILKRLPKDKAMFLDGKSVMDPTQLYYYGISNGGIQGTTMMALNPAIEKAVLNVPGGMWSLMISRSANFSALVSIMAVAYPDPAQRQLLIATTQPFFDYTDPLTYAPYFKDLAKHTGVTKKVKMLYQEGIGDAQVPNISTRTLIRSSKGFIKTLGPLFEPVFGLETVTGKVNGSAYVQYGPKLDPYPKDVNLPAKQNATHEAVRRIESAIKQIEDFFKPGGQIQQFCDGPCDPN